MNLHISQHTSQWLSLIHILEKKVDKHNTVIERTFKLEEAQAVMQEQIKVVNHRISDLEREE